MTVYVALLRGINVGGHNKIKMADLKRMFEEINLRSVQTYIQSGNVLFESEEEEAPLCSRIEHEIEEKFGISTPVVLRTARHLERIVLNCPFSNEEVTEAEASSEGESLYVSLLREKPSKEEIERLKAYQGEGEECRIEGPDVYLLFRRTVRNSKIASHLQKLDVPSTIRNWKTVNKLAALTKTMDLHAGTLDSEL